MGYLNRTFLVAVDMVIFNDLHSRRVQCLSRSCDTDKVTESLSHDHQAHKHFLAHTKFMLEGNVCLTAITFTPALFCGDDFMIIF